ncbi:autophagy-related protein 33 [Diutina catenulata]
MTGTCVSTIKCLGVASLGLASGSLLYQAYSELPRLIRSVSLQSNYAALKKQVTVSSVVHSVVAAIASGLFYTAYTYSPPFEKHPYLIYSGLSAALAGLGVWYGYPKPGCHCRKSHRTTSSSVKAPSASAEQLDKSYVHVSDEDSSVVSTPSSTTPSSPQLASNEEETAIDTEVSQTLLKKKVTTTLDKAVVGYTFSGAVAAVGFVLGAIGVLGDLY